MTRSMVVTFVCGVLFSVGLALGGMTNPEKVQGFLDFTGDWDPSLAFVMGGAVGVYALFFRLIRPRMAQPVFDTTFRVPNRTDLDGRLLLGAAVFGIGWGLGGVCPGPALAALPTGGWGGLAFIGCMVLGMRMVPSWGTK